MKRALSGTKASHYHGIDLSEPALELAAKNLEDVPVEMELDHRRHGSDQAAGACRRSVVRAFDLSPVDRRQARLAQGNPRRDIGVPDDL